MAQSKTVAAALFILAFAAAAASVAHAAASASEIAAVNNLLPVGSRKLLAGDGMIAITENDLMPLSAGKSLTTGRAGEVAIQRQLLDEDDWFPKDDFDKARSGVAGVQSQRQLIGMVPDTADNLLPLSAAEGLTKGRAGVVSIQKELTGGKVPAA